MSRTRYNQAGFEVVGVFIAILFLAVAGFAGFKVMEMNKSAVDLPSSAVTRTSVPSTIESQADLTAASKSLDQSGSQLDSNLNDGSLDADVNTLL